MPAASLRLRSAPSPRSEARGHFAADVASGVATQNFRRRDVGGHLSAEGGSAYGRKYSS